VGGRVVGTKTFHVLQLGKIKMVEIARGVVSRAILFAILSQIQINHQRFRAASIVPNGGAMVGVLEMNP
jgi:hypothetical protein